MHEKYYESEEATLGLDQSDPERYNRKKLTFMQPSPCFQGQGGVSGDCQDYCTFHERLQQVLNRTEFLTLMRLSLPQTKILMGDLNQYELELAKKIFGEKQDLLSPKYPQVSPMALAIFCKDRKDQSWTGDQLTDFKARLCNDFFSTLTDVGICHTKNLNLRNVFKKIPKDFEATFDVNQDPVKKIEGGNYWGEATFVLDTATFKKSTFLRVGFDAIEDRIDKLSLVQMQIQSTDEVPHILHGIYHASSLKSITLEAGHEYTIEIVPKGQTITEAFKELTPDDRQCKLKSETQSDWFLHYTELNCKYECKIKLAAQTCQCIPWDFYQHWTSEDY